MSVCSLSSDSSPFVPFCIPPQLSLLLSIQSYWYLKWPATLHRAHLCLLPSSYRFAFLNLAAISFAMHLPTPGHPLRGWITNNCSDL